MNRVAINSDRLWRSLMELAEIGATEKGGVCRLALTDLDKRARDLFIHWAKEAGCSVTIDRIGNIFARRPGRNNELPPVMTGSHIDTQPSGGKFDGNYGVMAGIEVVRTLNDFGIRTEAPIEVAVWTNEEGSRFTPVMTGSGVFAGAFDLDFALGRTDLEGKSIGAELERIGYAGDAAVGGRPVAAFFEAHIEQGPVLEDAGVVIGVVTGGLGTRWYDVTVTGQEAHAASTPMHLRRDALLGASRMVEEVNRIGLGHGPTGRATVGFMQVKPSSRNVIPGEVRFSIDFRHFDAIGLDAMDTAMRDAAARIARELGLSVCVEQVARFSSTRFDEACIAAVRKSARRLGLSHMDLVSGAGHDAVYLARVAPTGMLFVPCEGGISHNEIEYAKPQDLAAGCDVLLHAMLGVAGAGRKTRS